MKRLLVAPLLFYFFHAPVYACSCADFDVEEMFKSSDTVFIGKMAKKSRFYSFVDNRYTFEDFELFKSRLLKKDIVIWSEKNTRSCGANFQKISHT